MSNHHVTLEGLISNIEERLDQAWVRDVVVGAIREYTKGHVLMPASLSDEMVRQCDPDNRTGRGFYDELVSNYMNSGPQKPLF